MGFSLQIPFSAPRICRIRFEEKETNSAFFLPFLRVNRGESRSSGRIPRRTHVVKVQLRIFYVFCVSLKIGETRKIKDKIKPPDYEVNPKV